MTYDLLIKDARICDGAGNPVFHGAVGVRGGKIVEVGEASGSATRTINADGLVLTPGFIDIHTHYDAQVSWDPLLTCSCWHGVTSVLMGNCGVGVAPCRPSEKEIVSWDLVNVEAMPQEVLLNGVAWDEWESFPQYMQAIEKHGIALNRFSRAVVELPLLCHGRGRVRARCESGGTGTHDRPVPAGDGGGCVWVLAQPA